MSGTQSFKLNDIQSYMEGGGNVTHILNVDVSNEESPEVGNSIRAKLFALLGNQVNVVPVGGFNVPIKWKTSATAASSSTSEYYYSCNPMFTDAVVKEHTQKLLASCLAENMSRNGTPGFSYFVMKPLAINQAKGI